MAAAVTGGAPCRHDGPHAADAAAQPPTSAASETSSARRPDGGDETVEPRPGKGLDTLLLMCKHVNHHMPLLTSLELCRVPMSSAIAAAAALCSSGEALVSLVLRNLDFDESEGEARLSSRWNCFWGVMAAARRVRHLHLVDCRVCVGSFDGLGGVDQLHSLSLENLDSSDWMSVIDLQLSKLTRLAEVRGAAYPSCGEVFIVVRCCGWADHGDFYILCCAVCFAFLQFRLFGADGQELAAAQMLMSGLSSLNDMRSLQLDELYLTVVDASARREECLCTNQVPDVNQIRSINIEFLNEGDLDVFKALFCKPKFCGLTAIRMESTDVRMTDLTVLHHLTQLECDNFHLPVIRSEASLPRLERISCFVYSDYLIGHADWPKAVALCLPALKALHITYQDLWVRPDGSGAGLWPQGLQMNQLEVLKVEDLPHLPINMVNTCGAVQRLELNLLLSWSFDKRDDDGEDEEGAIERSINSLRCNFGKHLRSLKINVNCLNKALLECVVACPLLSDLWIKSPGSSRVDVDCFSDDGVAAMSHLRDLRHVTLEGAQLITKASLTALAMNPSVQSIHIIQCPKITWRHAQGLMKLIPRLDLDIRVTE